MDSKRYTRFLESSRIGSVSGGDRVATFVPFCGFRGSSCGSHEQVTSLLSSSDYGVVSINGVAYWRLQTLLVRRGWSEAEQLLHLVAPSLGSTAANYSMVRVGVVIIGRHRRSKHQTHCLCILEVRTLLVPKSTSLHDARIVVSGCVTGL